MAAFVQSVWLTLFATPLLALGMPVARLVLGAFNTSPEVLAAETLYFDILMLNAAFTILAQVLGYESSDAFSASSTTDTENKGDLISMESLYGAELWNAISPATEAFGIQMDRVTPDL